MNKIEEVIKEHGYTITSLAKKIGTSKQNLFAKLKSPSYPTLIEIATALNVPIWQLFVSPNEVAGGGDELTASIRYQGKFFNTTSKEELKQFVNDL